MKEELLKKLKKAAKEKIFYEDAELTNFALSELDNVLEAGVNNISNTDYTQKKVYDESLSALHKYLEVAINDAMQRKTPKVDLLALNNAKQDMAQLWPFF
ncbi:MAG: hypothetical protein EOO01_42365 [Chitinophagaceae bacterium]|nr:MAG: hypothetical protein EOO01_42365 [Chitinophagaceae bacterium]